MIYPIQRLHIAVQEGTGIEYTPEDAKTLLSEICALEQKNEKQSNILLTIKAETERLYPDNSVFRSAVEGIEEVKPSWYAEWLKEQK